MWDFILAKEKKNNTLLTHLFCASPTIFTSPSASAMRHVLLPPMMKCWITSPKCLPGLLHLLVFFLRRESNPSWYFLNHWYCWAAVIWLRVFDVNCNLTILFFTLPAFFLKKVRLKYRCAWMRVSLGSRSWSVEMDSCRASPPFARSARTTILASKSVFLVETMAFRPSCTPTFPRFTLSLHAYFWKVYGEMPLECENLKILNVFTWASIVAVPFPSHSLMAFSRLLVLFFNQLFHAVIVSFGGDARRPEVSLAGTWSQRGLSALRHAALLLFWVSGVLSDVGSTSVTPLEIYSASDLLLLCLSSVPDVLFLCRQRCNSFHFSFNMTKPLRIWKPPFVRSFDVKANLGRTIMVTVFALWWYEVWEKCEVVNCGRVVINADSILPPLVASVPLYSCAAESDWIMKTSNVPGVFDAEHITIVMC